MLSTKIKNGLRYSIQGDINVTGFIKIIIEKK